ncbi:MAG: LysR family transcriptional regulator [Pseudomonadota bacterium]
MDRIFIIHEMDNVGALDLNLLRVFDAVMAERNVTRASERLYLSQPAVSHALGRLRHALQDDLFVKVPAGVRPTPKALELSGPVGEALAALERALNPPVFDPKTSSRVFRIATHDYLVTVLIAELAAALAARAPGVSVRIRPTEGRALEMLDAQEADMAISAFGELPERFDEQVLMQDRYVCLMRPDHPLATGRITLKRFAAARHLLISPRGDARGFVDDALAAHGLTRHVAMIINQFSPAGGIVAASDLVVTASERIALAQAGRHQLVTRPCPVEVPATFTRTSVVWHRRLGEHPALAWLRALLVEVAADG